MSNVISKCEISNSMVILTMGIDQDYVNFYVEILNSGTYEPTNFDLEGFMESY